MQQPMMDQYGRPIIVLDTLTTPSEPKGTQMLEANISAVNELASFITSSFGPKGKDKLIVDQDREITLTNDGATILGKIGLQSPIGRLILGLSVAQDLRSGDGTTGIVLLCSALLNSAVALIRKGVNAARLEKIYFSCSQICYSVIKNSSIKNLTPEHTKAAIRCSLNTKLAKHSSAIDSLTRVSMELASLKIIPELFKIEKRISRTATSSAYLLKGLLLDKTFYNPLMASSLKNPSIILLSCAIEPPKPKTKHILKIASKSDYNSASKFEDDFFTSTITALKDKGVDLVFCQWGFDEEAGYLLKKHNINAVTWIGGKELEMLSLSTGAEIVSNLDNIKTARLGTCQLVQSVSFLSLCNEKNKNLENEEIKDLSLCGGEEDSSVLLVKGCPLNNACTVLLTAGSKTVLDEIHRSFDDSLGVASLLQNNSEILCGGGAVEIEMSKKIREIAKEKKGIEKEVMEKFAEGLLEIPRILARNAEVNEEIELGNVVRRNQKEGNRIGVDGEGEGENDMEKKGVIEPVESKMSQVMMAVDIARMILRIDDVIVI